VNKNREATKKKKNHLALALALASTVTPTNRKFENLKCGGKYAACIKFQKLLNLEEWEERKRWKTNAHGGFEENRRLTQKKNLEFRLLL
jgi:hypothetical protein